MIKPGFSATLGVSQGSHTPYARVTGRALGIVSSKKLDLNNPLSLVALLGIAMFSANKQAKAVKAKKTKALAAPVTPTTALVQQGIEALFGGKL